ncbi:hypothetical protein [Intrasporangium flavum]|uniref:hypothetical protein n=1 Tax=Intrasporangium flavum TaxID=1428657 RepID=UPI00096CAEAD|nr:hypothetical protein [Intrasporangium flavum]
MSGYGPATVVRLGPVVDVLTTDEGTVALVEREVGHQVVRVSDLGSVVLELLEAGPATVAEVAAELVELYGAPPDSDPLEATGRALADMSRTGLISADNPGA